MIGVLIVAEIRLYSEGLAQVLERSTELCVAGVAGSREEALAILSTAEPDVILLDMDLPDSLATVGALVEAVPGVKVVALAVAEVESEVLACVEAGVCGWVRRDASLDDLIGTVTDAMRGKLTCSPRIAASLLHRVNRLASTRSPSPQSPSLTPRQLEIAMLIDKGLSNKQIAKRLCISSSTVKNHVHSLLEKVQVHRRGEAVAMLRPVLDEQLRRRV